MDEKSFFSFLGENSGSNGTEAARDILNWAKDKGLRIDWGRGSTRGMFQPLVEHGNHIHHTISVWTHGKIQIEFVYMEPPFNTDKKRQELIARINEIQGISVPLNKINAEPPIPLDLFYDKNRLKQFIEVLDWVIEEIRST